MKLNKDNIKGMLETYLQKEGSSLEELEKVLANKEGSVKIAGNMLMDALTSGLNATVAGTTGIGALGGMLGYGGYSSLAETQKMIDGKLDERRKIMQANNELQRLLGQQHRT